MLNYYFGNSINVITRNASGTLRTVYSFQGVNEIGRDVPNVSDVIEL